ncbi:MAG: NADH-quinone oxidoreductase subunit L [Rubrobacteraceae bacterium]|nr:NADH-quinone oxidoreductase subunit L [Rubrobacteraceae bacterium]MBA3614628.1 NADH-quinone oxidoreductase subunit L [Rubrobacteraceae bacterium]
MIITAIPTLPALVFLVLVLTGRLLEEAAQYVAILGVTISLVFSVFALLFVAGIVPGGGAPIEFSVNWIDLNQGGSFPVGVYIDGLAAVMLVVVSFVSLMIQLYSGAFMEGDKRFAWFYAVLNLFTASMLGLVLAPNFIQLYIFWELVGLCSYLLVGHWFEKPSARDAAIKAFVVTRIGDAALFVGIIIFWATTGSTAFTDVSEAAQAGFIGGSLFTTAVILVFVGAVGKSAQFPLHVWLPDAMEGPTPVSALIHAATMVAAGVYLVARTYDIFVQSPTAMLVVAYIGGFTALMAATMALVKKDIKRVIAYSTVSQLGYMMLGLGLGSYTAGIFHLYNHAFFKALLFLCAGSIIYAMDSYNLFEMGGLRRRMPITFWAMVIAGISLSGIFPFAGFWSKDAIVASAYEEHYYLLFGMALLTVFLTAFYIFRAIFLAFTGEPRSEPAREAAESPGIMTGPMLILAFLAIVSGWVGIPEGFGLPIRDYFSAFVHPSEFAVSTLGLEEHAFSFALGGISVAVALLGIGLAYALYVARPEWAGALTARLSWLHTFLDKGWYFDALYGATVVRFAMWLGRATRGFDRNVIGGLVGGLGRGTLGTGGLLQRLQSGGVQNYALFILLSVLIIGVIVGAQYAVMVVGLIVLITVAAFAVGARL